MNTSPHSSEKTIGVENEMIACFFEQNKTENDRRKIKMKFGIDVDGFSTEHNFAVEAYTHVGIMKPATIKKVTNDAFKLLCLEKWLGKKVHKIILLLDSEVKNYFGANRWQGRGLDMFGIDLFVIKSVHSTRWRSVISKTQTVQGQRFKNKKKN